MKLNLELMANNIIIREKKSEKQKIKNTRKMCVWGQAQKSVFKARYTFYVQVSLIIYKKGGFVLTLVNLEAFLLI